MNNFDAFLSMQSEANTTAMFSKLMTIASK